MESKATQSNHVVCPQCCATNRIPRARMDEAPRCGKCRKPIFLGTPIELSSESFDRHANADIPMLVDFWAPWCGPCRVMAPEFEKVAAQLEPNVRVAKLNTENAQALASAHSIRSIPTIALFHKGREIARRSGAMPAAEIIRWVDTLDL